MGGELPEGLVDQRVIQVGLDDPGLQVVRDDPPWRAPEELQSQHVGLDPGALVHAQHGSQEHQARAGQDDDEAPHPAHALRRRVEPPAQQAIVDLGFVPGRRGVAQHPNRVTGHLLVEVGPDEPAQRGLRDAEAVVVTQALVDGGHRHHPEPALDPLAMRFDLRPRDLAQAPVDNLRKPAGHQGRPLLLAQRRAAGGQPRLGRLRRVLAHRLGVHRQRRAHLPDAPAGVPVPEDLHYVNHPDRSPCHSPSSSWDARG